MEIIKKSENFNLKDTTEVFEMNGNFSYDTSGTLIVHFNVKNLDGSYVGDCQYNAYGESNNVSFTVSCSEPNRDALTAYANTIISAVIEHCKTNN